MANKGRSTRGAFGTINHYDSKGRKTGQSRPGMFGGYTHYDSKGRKTGSSAPGLFGGYTHYDSKGHKMGTTNPTGFGGYSHRDSHYKSVGSSYRSGLGSVSHSNDGGPNMFCGDPYRKRPMHTSTKNSSSSGNYSGSNYSSGGSSQGCYVATCVYGSYDCPQVWTLRRFRDDMLAKSAAGRAFIRTYYAISPTIVKWFGGMNGFHKVWKPVLDAMVKELNCKGVQDTPYQDRTW